MSRRYPWVTRGMEYIDPVPMNWGTTLTLLGAIRVEDWVVLRSMWATAQGVRFVPWLTTHLLPVIRGVNSNKLRPLRCSGCSRALYHEEN